ncbi:MAG: cell division protein ZapA [Deltaproteobacteria bacterium]|nr:cell division protein ZapA [Deltaproteobacteria bacterium]
MEQLITIELFGQPYKFKSAPETDNAQEVAEVLVKEVGRIQDQQSKEAPGITQIAILILAALNIANENMELKKNYSTLQETVSRRSDTLKRLLDAELN